MLVKNIAIEPQPKQVIRKFQIPASTQHFVRDGHKILKRIARLLAEVMAERHMEPLAHWTIAWEKAIDRFAAHQLRKSDQPPLLRILVVVEWYRDHFDDDQYIPRIESAKTLIDKFLRLEDAMRRRTVLQHPSGRDLTPKEVLKQNGITHQRIVDSMLRDIIRPAKRLHLIDLNSEATLAARLAELYGAVQQERAQAKLTPDLKLRVGGPLQVLRDYIGWLGEREWEASSRVLKPDSNAFAQFRRDYRNLEGLDPVNGTQRSYD